ncbi:MAG: MFS transporter [Candidatus Marinimicrobia bacterium]|nr:MFS transporter [Candidatus Neomarinimicrobiota bacterium]
MSEKKSLRKEYRNPWAWVPSLYFAEGIPYVVVMTVSVIMYKRLGLSNTEIALYTSWLYLPWVIKPLWSPIVDILKTKRFWITTMQLFIGAGFAGIALTIPAPNFVKYTLALLWLMAFSSATHDIAADGFYMLALTEHEQAWFVGIRSTFYRLAMITGQGLLVILAGYIESTSGLPSLSTSVQSKPGIEMTAMLNTNAFPDSAFSGEQRVILSQTDLSIGIQPVSKAVADSVIKMVKEMNIQNEFYSEENQKQKDKAPSLWSRAVAKPLEKTLRKYFSAEKKETRAGNYGYIYLRLAQQPPSGKNVIVNLGRDAGDKSISLAEGGRYVFTDKNWNKPAVALIQLDAKLRTETATQFKATAGNITLSWSITFFVLAGLFILFFVWHRFILPAPKSDIRAVTSSEGNIFTEFWTTFVTFFKRDHIGAILTFLLLYRFGEAQLVKLIYPFLLDPREVGGLALTTGQVGIAYGTVGILALTFGGILGGMVVAKKGLKFWLWWMLLIIHLPDCVFIYLSQVQPDNFSIVNICIAIEQFGYGFGFTAYMMYMIYVSEGQHKTAHYAICTGFMALGMMLPGMMSGWLEDIIGYQHFFIWVVFATVPSFIAALFIPLDTNFAKKTATEKK